MFHLNVFRCRHAYPDEQIREVFIAGLPTAICNGVRKFCSCKLKARLTELSQYSYILLDQQLRHAEEPREALSRGRVNKRTLVEVVVTTVGGVEDNEKPPQPKPVADENFASKQVHKTIMDEQGKGKLYRLCSATNHNLHQCSFTCTELETIREVNFRIRYSARRDNHSRRYKRCEECRSSLRQGNALPVTPVREQQDRLDQDA